MLVRRNLETTIFTLPYIALERLRPAPAAVPKPLPEK